MLSSDRYRQVLSNTIKEKRKQKAGKWSVPLPKVAPITEDEMFKVIKTGKRKSKTAQSLCVYSEYTARLTEG